MAVWPSLDQPDSQPIDNRPQGVITTYALYNMRIYFKSIIKQTNFESLWAGSYGQLQRATGARWWLQAAVRGHRRLHVPVGGPAEPWGLQNSVSKFVKNGI
jgi:hypothetical protein